MDTEATQRRLAWNLHTDPEAHFCMRIPPGWTVDCGGRHGSRLAAYAPSDTAGFRGNINLLLLKTAGTVHVGYCRLFGF
jgi:hypothetical protein